MKQPHLEIDKRYGRGTVIKCLENPLVRKHRWLLRCECGKTYEGSADNILRNKVTQCHSCVIRVRAKTQSITLTQVLHARPEHANVKHSLYRIWAQMIQRCENPNNAWYHCYGARGIKVCEIWRNSFIEYAKYVDSVLGPRPSLDHSLDREANEGNYEPGNLRWATAKEQANNRRTC
jgi:hypothetical protein